MRGGQYIFYGILLLACFAIYLVFNRAGSNNFDMAKKEVVLRKIGHELLLQSGDSTSRVLPVKKVEENEYQIRFENKLSFQPDSLVNLTRRLLTKSTFPPEYVVNVLYSGNGSVIFGYAISGNEQDNIVACSGRVQPKASYMVNLKFKPTATNTASNNAYLLGLPFLAFAGFIVFRSVKQRKPSKVQGTKVFTFGPVLFDAQERQLTINEKAVELTKTETRLLLIFASTPNEVIERSRLQKEIWEDEGVIVGRSLDMFISKLRKKLEVDPNINIVVVRGKGYKLETSYQEAAV